MKNLSIPERYHPPRQPSCLTRTGTTTVQFVLVVPLLMMFMLAGFELFRLSMVHHVIDNAAYEACRSVIVPGASAAEAELRVNQVLSKIGIVAASVVIQPSPILESTSEVTVEITAPAISNS